MTGGIIFDREPQGEEDVHLDELSSIDELSGSLERNTDDQKLMHSVLENDKSTIEEGMLIQDSINQGLGSFTPDLLFEKLVKDFKDARRIFGDSFLRELTGYDASFLEKNMALPEFRRELKENIIKQVEKLKKDGLVNKEGNVTDKGVKLSALILLVQELDRLMLKGFGEREERKKATYGEKSDYGPFRKERYRDIAIRQSVKTAIRRSHTKLRLSDLRVFDRRKKGKITVIYGMDSSGSMKGEKLAMAKKAGVALAYKATSEKNNVGLVVFDAEVRTYIPPTTHFPSLLDALANVRAGLETDITMAITKSIELFPKHAETKHLILLTDALPTRGKDPELETIQSVAAARNQHITISLIGINLDTRGIAIAKKIVEMGNGRLYIVKDVSDIDALILEEYREI
jgi:Mg-chelatase subunit ChlD